MKAERFNELVNELRNASLDTLVAKNAGYSSEDDKLHNFHVGGSIMGGTAAQAAWGYATKHLVALRDKIQRNDFSDRADFLEKCQDAINYICLIWCIGNEEAEKYTQPEGRPHITYENMFKHNFPQKKVGDTVVRRCPGDFFLSAPHRNDVGADACCGSCRNCWSRLYQGEEVLHDHP